MITARFDIEPRPKGRPRFFNGRTLTDAKTRKYESDIKHMALELRVSPLCGEIRVSVRFIFVSPKRPTNSYPSRRDIDNLQKAIFDPLNGVFWNDDDQISEVVAVKLYDKTPTPRARIEIEVHEVTHG